MEIKIEIKKKKRHPKNIILKYLPQKWCCVDRDFHIGVMANEGK